MSSNKNEVFEYLIDQLRRQINKKDVTSFNVSVQISDLDEVKQVIHNLQQHIAGKDDEIRALKDSLRQQLPVVDVMGEIKRWSIDRSIAGRGNYTDEENAIIDAYIGLERNPYKQQCEDLAHEVQSLKNQLRYASAQIKELTCALDCAENEVMCLRSTVDLDPKGAIGYIRRANSAMTDTLRRQYLSKALEELGCKDAPEQSGCRKEDVQECEHDYRLVTWCSDLQQCYKCGKIK